LAREPPRAPKRRAPRQRAGQPRRPRCTPPKAARRPRSHLPNAPAPRGSWESYRAACCRVRAVPAGCAPQTAGPMAASRRTRTGRGRVPRRYLRRPLQSPRSRAAPINTPHFPLLHRHCHAAAPSVPPPSSSAPSCLPRSSNRPYPFLRTYKVAACHLLSRPSPRRCRSRATAAASVGPRRASTPACSPPQQALGEPTVVPRRFPSQERGRLAGIWPAPPPPMAKGRIASPKLFVGCFV
jgi:hypothetical protein